MTDFNVVGDWAGFFGQAILLAVGGSIILLATLIIFCIAFIGWRQKWGMAETYIIVFLALGFLRLFANDASFNDTGIFGMLHNLMLIGSALVWGKLLTSGPTR